MESLWLLHVDLFVQVAIGESGGDVNRMELKVFNCCECHDNAECCRAEGGCETFVVVKSRTLRVAFCNNASLEAFNGTILVVLYLEYPTRSNGLLALRQIHYVPGPICNESVVLAC